MEDSAKVSKAMKKWRHESYKRLFAKMRIIKRLKAAEHEIEMQKLDKQNIFKQLNDYLSVIYLKGIEYKSMNPELGEFSEGYLHATAVFADSIGFDVERHCAENLPRETE